ncbi:MAG TPA: HAD family hydrolase, partial [Gemmatirosa sp.]
MTTSTPDRAVARPFPRAILFDFGGTLDADGLPTIAQFHAAYRAEGGRHDTAAFGTAFRGSDHRLAALTDIATLGYTATVAAQARLLADLCADEPAVDWSAVAARVTAGARAVVARNRPVLEAIRGRARLGVVSNFTGNVDRCLGELGLLDVFDTVADSALVGHAKPDPEVFHIALRALGTAPDDALMVGDNPFADVRAAAAVGLATCWL